MKTQTPDEILPVKAAWCGPYCIEYIRSRLANDAFDETRVPGRLSIAQYANNPLEWMVAAGFGVGAPPGVLPRVMENLIRYRHSHVQVIAKDTPESALQAFTEACTDSVVLMFVSVPGPHWVVAVHQEDTSTELYDPRPSTKRARIGDPTAACHGGNVVCSRDTVQRIWNYPHGLVRWIARTSPFFALRIR